MVAAGRVANTAPWRKTPISSKYGNKKTEVDGIVFDSKREAKHWIELKSMQQRGEIFNLRRQVKFELIPAVRLDGRMRPATKYVADFVYTDKDGKEVVADSKGFKTDVWMIKRKMMAAFHGIEVKEL